MKILKIMVLVVFIMVLVMSTLSGCAFNDGTISVRYKKNVVTMSYSDMELRYNLETGFYSVYNRKKVVLENVLAECSVKDDATYTSDMYEKRIYDYMEVNDKFGKGFVLTVINTNQDMPTLKQYFYMYYNKDYMLIKASVEKGGDIIASNYLSPLTMSADIGSVASLGKLEELHFLEVPYDNDNYNRYNARELQAGLNPKRLFSSEVTVLYSSNNYSGICLGSVQHDKFKSGIETHETDSVLTELKLYAGAANEITRDDTEIHGYVYDSVIHSPLMFLSVVDDYRDGLELYADASSIATPPLEWNDGVIFGWNSWAAHADKVSYNDYVAASDYLKESLPSFNNEGITYINFDSFWDNLTESEIRQAVERAHSNGQRAGIYYTPFVLWWDAHEQDVNGTDGEFKYKDIILKGNGGEDLKVKNSYLTLDPTHPGTIKLLEYNMERFIDWGFDYIKLDFLSNGAQEGEHYDSNITTGTMAYNYGMSKLADLVSYENIGREFFISLAISPTFPNQYAHARRISCDAFGSMDSTEYMLNSLTYGWWMNGKIYKYNDPDHIVVYQSYNMDAPSSENEGQSRLNSSIIAGTIMLGSDNMTDSDAASRVQRLFSNTALINIAKLGQTFRPMQGSVGQVATDKFYLVTDNYVYVAVFNYTKTVKNTNLNLAMLGLDNNKSYPCTNLNNGNTFNISSTYSISLEAHQSFIYRIELV